jgi:uncharacterized protein with NAD-binding domain and iron-sulfur cluster
MPSLKPKIAILGGGVAGVTAAWELSRQGWEEHFESITVYQRGWRLGGKGASGRGEHGRIEEHGLHIWLGFYENAFRMMRECYDELTGASGFFASVDEAFERSSSFVVTERRPEGWLMWPAEFPEDDSMPGGGDPLPSPWQLVVRAIALAEHFLRSVHRSAGVRPADNPVRIRPAEPRPASRVRLRTLPPPFSDRLGRLLDSASAWITEAAGMTAEGVVATALAIAAALEDDPEQHEPEVHGGLISLLELAAELARHVLLPARLTDAERREWYLADILMACVRGVLRDGLLTHPDGLDAIDQWDFTDWLIHHGADSEAAGCALITTVVYDLQFAYREGDPDRPSCSAATALRGLVRLFFSYRGAIAWKMRAGMGDAIFAPLYHVLVGRGVQFRFFHRIDGLHPSADGRRIASINVAEQVALRDPDTPYDPLIDVRGLWCWPNRPRTELLADADGIVPDELESIWRPSGRPDVRNFDLRDGDDFDIVVLAIPVGAHRLVCKDLVQAKPAWRRSADHIGTIYTQAFQLWLSATMEDLGCPGSPATTGGYLEPFDTYADMGQLIERENWPDGHVKAIAYFCNAMPTPTGRPDPDDHGLPARENAKVKASALRFLRRNMAELWPSGVKRYPTDFQWDLLVAEDSRQGPARFDSQFWRANVDPSERYVLPLPGTARYRLHPGRSGYQNLYVAGDWTACGLNAGCVEAAVISGMLAANAISGSPKLSAIVGYRHW